MSIQKTSRRQFLGQAAAISAAVAVPYHFTSSQAFAKSKSKNERLQYALIGVGGNGTRTCPTAQEYVELVALCDVDANHLRDGNKLLADGKADTYADYREVLDREDVDVVGISTPDHWHTKILIEAMLAGWQRCVLREAPHADN